MRIPQNNAVEASVILSRRATRAVSNDLSQLLLPRYLTWAASKAYHGRKDGGRWILRLRR